MAVGIPQISIPKGIILYMPRLNTVTIDQLSRGGLDRCRSLAPLWVSDCQPVCITGRYESITVSGPNTARSSRTINQGTLSTQVESLCNMMQGTSSRPSHMLSHRDDSVPVRALRCREVTFHTQTNGGCSQDSLSREITVA